jgi:hypothetical protein
MERYLFDLVIFKMFNCEEMYCVSVRNCTVMNVLYSIVQYSTVQYSTLQYSTVQYTVKLLYWQYGCLTSKGMKSYNMVIFI